MSGFFLLFRTLRGLRCSTGIAVGLAWSGALSGCGGAGSGAAAGGELPAVCAERSESPSAASPTSSVARAARQPALPPAPAPHVLLHGATLLTAAGAVHETGWVRLQDGRIAEVGEGAYDLASAPADAIVIDATGRWITPGLIDTHSHLGVYPSPSVQAHWDGNEATAPTTAGVEAVHSVWPQDAGFERAAAGGVTSLHILPGSANLIGGRGFTLKNRPGALHAEELRIVDAPETVKMACGENPKRVYGGRNALPSTRMGSLAVMRQTFADAQRYRDARSRYEERLATWCDAGAPEAGRPEPPARSLANETLAGVLDGSVLPQVHCYRADDMLSFLQLADEYGFDVRSFHHAVEAYKIREELAARSISVSTWADWWGFKMEALDTILEAPGLIATAGARTVIHSDSEIGIQRLNQEAAKSWFASIERGMELSYDDVIRWITVNPAWTLGIDHRTGTLEPGKDADLVVWSHDPFSIYATADLVFVEGAITWDRSQGRTPWSDFEAGQWPSRWEDQP